MTRRNPTETELMVSEALTHWLEDVDAEMLRSVQLTKGRYTTTWKTPAGCLVFTVADNRVVGIAAQIDHGDPEEMIGQLNCWCPKEGVCSSIPQERPCRVEARGRVFSQSFPMKRETERPG
jgi:hypothetical protein